MKYKAAYAANNETVSFHHTLLIMISTLISIKIPSWLSQGCPKYTEIENFKMLEKIF